MLGKRAGTVVATAALAFTAFGVGASPALAETPAGPEVGAAWKQEVGPYSDFGPCDYDRRLYKTRYGYTVYDCQKTMSGWWFWYDVK